MLLALLVSCAFIVIFLGWMQIYQNAQTSEGVVLTMAQKYNLALRGTVLIMIFAIGASTFRSWIPWVKKYLEQDDDNE